MTTSEPAAKDGNEMIDEIAKAPNLDRFFDQNPANFTTDDYRALIEIERQRRAIFIEKKGK